MTRARLVLIVLAVPALLAAAAPGAAAAPPDVLKVPVPRAGDITVAHVVFEPSATRSRRLPRFRFLGAGSRRVLRAYGIGAAAASLRLRRGRVVGSLVLLRRRDGRNQRATPRRALRVATDGPVAFALAERNALADLRGRNPTAADDADEGFEPIDGFGDVDAGLGACRVGSKFRLIGDPDPPRLALNLFVDLPVGDDDVRSNDPGFGGLGLRQRSWVFEVGYAAACDDIERFEDKPGEAVMEDFYSGLGARLPLSCQIVSTYVSPVMDSNGNRLTLGSFSTQFGCDIVIAGVTLRLPGHTITDCQASAGLDCRFAGDMAGTRIPLRPGEAGSFSLRADPELQRGDRYELTIDTPKGNLHVEDVM